MTKVVVYARYACGNDDPIKDQFRLCREYAAQRGWEVVATYDDPACSGIGLERPGLQALLGDARGGKFNVLLSADLAHLSRDLWEIETLSERLRAAGVSIITVAEGALHDNSTTDPKNLADMVRRVGGQLGEDRAERRLIYGYEMTVNHVIAEGKPISSTSRSMMPMPRSFSACFARLLLVSARAPSRNGSMMRKFTRTTGDRDHPLRPIRQITDEARGPVPAQAAANDNNPAANIRVFDDLPSPASGAARRR
jgi:hypothetical protein